MTDDFNDSLDGMFDGRPRPMQERLPDGRTKEQKLEEVLQRSTDAPAVFNERCDKCGGTGHWRNPRFECFKCKGKGTLSFKSSPQARAKARARGAEKAIERDRAKVAWREEHSAEIAWAQKAAAWNAKSGGAFDFPQKLLEGLDEYGTWTDGQLAAVQRLMARQAERRAENIAKRSSAIDATKIEAAFAAARERAARPGMQGLWTKPLKLRARNVDLVFSPGSVGSEFEGMIFVKDGSGTKLGWIKNGEFTRRRECNDHGAAAVKEACEDPHLAANAFAKAWKCCGICNRTLTADESIERGIGPICAERYGWA